MHLVTPHTLLLLAAIATVASVLLWSRWWHRHPPGSSESRPFTRFYGAVALTIGGWLIGYYAILHVFEAGSPAVSAVQAGIYVTALAAILELVQVAFKPRRLVWWQAGAAAAGMVLVWAKFSHHIYGMHLPFFFIAKWTVAALMLVTVTVCAVALSLDATRRPAWVSIGVGLLIVLAAAVADLWILPRGFVSSRLPLGTGYPLTLATFACVAMFYWYRSGVGSEATPEALGLPARPDGTTLGERLFISESTVKNHLHNIYEKVGVTGRMELLSRIFRQQ